MIRIFIDEQEIAYCDRIGLMRYRENVQRGQPSNIEKHQEGCYAEYVVSKYFRRPWEGIYYEGKDWDNRGNDVQGLEVKCSFRYNDMALDCLDPTLFPNTPFIFLKLLRLTNRIRATMRGWIYGREAAQHGVYKVSHQGEDFLLVDRKHFRPIEELLRILEK